MKYTGLSLIEGLEANGRRTFTVSEAMKRLRLPHKSVMEILARLRQSQRIVTLSHGLYALLHPSERKYGLRPLPVIDTLMKHRKIDYYVGLLSAADHWGAAHHKPQILQVITPKQITLRKAKNLRIRLYVQKHLPKVGIAQGKTESGYFKVSSPELTALDVLTYESVCGGFDNACLVIHDLMEQIKTENLLSSCKNYHILSSIQRLGYILEKFGASKKIVHPFKNWIKKQKSSPVALLSSIRKSGKVHSDWQVIENTKLNREP